MSTKKKAVLCFSGGLDSTVLLYLLQRDGYKVYPLSVDYGQRHYPELAAAKRIVQAAGIGKAQWQRLDLASLCTSILVGSSQTCGGIEVPEGHYAEESMKATVVPNRNMILLSLATAWAVSLKAEVVAYAAHAGDHTIYPDCRAEFIGALGHAITLCDWTPPRLTCPFSGMTKSQVVAVGADLNVPFNLTYSCYKGGDRHCGKCGTCVERREAFQVAEVPDPTVYVPIPSGAD